MKREEPTIQYATPIDAPSLAKLAERTFRDAFSHLNNKENFEKYVAASFTEGQIRSELMDPAVDFLIACIGDKWVGYAKLHESHPPDCVKPLPAIELSRLYSEQRFLGCGIGPALMNACIAHAKERAFRSVWLGSWQENHRGNAFYKKMRFEVLGEKTFVMGSENQEDFIYVKSIG